MSKDQCSVFRWAKVVLCSHCGKAFVKGDLVIRKGHGVIRNNRKHRGGRRYYHEACMDGAMRI